MSRLRTIALLMLAAGLSLGVFAHTAWTRFAGGDRLVEAPRTAAPDIEARVDLYRRAFRLDDRATAQVREELERYDRQVQAKLWELRRRHEDEFSRIGKDAQQRIEAVLAGTSSR